MPVLPRRESTLPRVSGHVHPCRPSPRCPAPTLLLSGSVARPCPCRLVSQEHGARPLPLVAVETHYTPQELWFRHLPGSAGGCGWAAVCIRGVAQRVASNLAIGCCSGHAPAGASLPWVMGLWGSVELG